MENIFITDVVIEKVRHLENVHIPLSEDKLKHLIITGKNGSGKTSVLNSLAGFLNAVTTTSALQRAEDLMKKHSHSAYMKMGEKPLILTAFQAAIRRY